MKIKTVRSVLVEIKSENTLRSDRRYIILIDDKIVNPFKNQYYELILISLDPGEKIEEGDSWIGHKIGEIEEESKLILITPENRKSILHHVVKSNFGKVIATQDKISPEYIQQFIEEYNKGEVKDVEIEMNVVTMQESSKSYEDNDILVNGKIVESVHYELTEIIDKTIEKYGKQPKLTNGFITVIEKSNIEKQADLVEEIAFENLKVKEPITYTEEEVLRLLIKMEESGEISYQHSLRTQVEEWFEQNRKK